MAKLEPIGVRASAATSKLSQLKLTKEHDARRVELARKAVEKAQQALEEAIAADLASTAALQKAESESSKVLQEERIQKLVDERYEAKRSRQYDKADSLESQLRDMGVQVSGPHLSWQGPGGLSGKVGVPMRAGEWECTHCDIAVPPRANKCNKCGARKPGSSGNDRDDRGGRDRSRGRRPPSRDRGDRRGDGRDRRDRGGRRRRSPSSSS